MAITTQMRTDVSQLYVALFGRAPDGEGLGYWVSQLDAGKSIVDIANAMYGTAPARTYYPSYLTNQEIVGNFYTNVLGRTADAEGLAYWTDKLNAAGATPGSVIAEIIGVVANYTGTDPEGLKSAALFQNKVQVAQWYGEQNGNIAGATSILDGVTEDPATVEAAKTGGVQSGQTFTLTTGVDNITGTSGSDTILAVAATTGATLSAADQINGGAGTDTLKLTIDTLAANSVPAASTTGVEVIDVRNVSGNAQTINGTNFIGNTSIINNVSTSQLDLVNVKTSSVTVQGNNTATLGATNIAVSATIGNAVVAAADSVTQAFTLNIAGGTKGTANIYVDDTNADWTAATINSTGAANTVGVVNLSGLQATAATHTVKDLTINAATNLTVGAAGGAEDLTGFDTGATVTNTITVKGAAASVVLNTVAGAVDVIDASGLTAGGVTADISGTTNEAKFKFTGGAGNDTVITDAGLTDSAAFIDGGAGVDTLALTTAETVAAQAARLKNFETLQLNAGITQDASLLTASAIDKIVFNFAGAAAVTNLSAAQAANVWVKAAPTNLSVGVKGADTVGQIDTVKVTVDDGDVAVNTIALGTPVLTGVEKLELTANDNTTITALTSASALNSIILKGAGTIGLTSGAITPQVNTVIDGSAATGALTINLGGVVGAATTNAVAITGGTKADTITASGGAADVINGKGGLDLITVTKDGASSGFAKVVTEATTSADADFITGFVTAENKFVLSNGLVNGSGTSADGTVAAEVVSAATFAAGLADAQAGNKTVFIATTDLAGGNGNAELTTLATAGGGSFTAANQAALIAKLVGTGGALNGTIANLDSVLGATDAAILVLDDGTNSVALRITNTDTAVANTLTAAEIQVVGVFSATAALAAADFA